MFAIFFHTFCFAQHYPIIAETTTTKDKNQTRTNMLFFGQFGQQQTSYIIYNIHYPVEKLLLLLLSLYIVPTTADSDSESLL